MSLLGSGEINSISNVRKEGDTTLFTWTVGRWRKRGFGDGITSSLPVQAGNDEWKLTFYPKGFTDPDWASLYVTNITCDLDDGDPLQPNAITTSALASVKVTFQPMLLGKKDAGGGAESGKAGGSQAGGSSAASVIGSVFSSVVASTAPSSSSRGRSKTGSSQSGSRAGGGMSKGKDLEPVIKQLSTQFTNLESSWGWEQYLDMDKLYSIKSGYVQDVPGLDGASIPEGRISMDIEILAVTGIDMECPRNDPEITGEGRLRTRWTIKDFYTLSKKVQENQKISSSDFESDGSFFLDIYPRGYRTETAPNEDSFLSVYLHSTRQQVELGETLKQSFRLGIQKANAFKREDYVETLKESLLEADDDAYFPPGSSVTAVFNPEKKCYGKQKLMRVNKEKGPLRFVPMHLKKAAMGIKDFDNELVAGTYSQGGAITIILDMSVTDVMDGTIQHMLHMVSAFDNPHMSVCPDTGKRFDRHVMLGGCRSAKPCFWCGRLFDSDVLRCGPESRFPDWGYEVGVEFIVDCLMREEEHELYRAMSKFSVDKKLDEGLALVQARVASFAVTKKSDQEADPEVDVSEDPTKLSGQRRKLWEKELKIQQKFQRNIEELRASLEDAEMSKPVCGKCYEECKAYQKLHKEEDTCIPASVIDIPLDPDGNMILDVPLMKGGPKPAGRSQETEAEKRERYLKNFTHDWRKAVKDSNEAYLAMNECMSTINRWGGQTSHVMDEHIMLTSAKVALKGGRRFAEKGPFSAMTLSTGGWYCDPPELTRQCQGRVNSDEPPLEDDDVSRNSFCDVRFDRRSGSSKTVPKAVVCSDTGKLFCKKCCRWKCLLPEWCKDPAKATFAQVCLDSKFKRTSREPGRVQPVSKKPPVEDLSNKKRTVAGAQEVEEEEDDDEGILGVIRSVPFCGESLADKLNPEG